MFEKINKHMKGQTENPAEDFRLTNEAKWPYPSLEQMYWKNPNAERGEIARCAYNSGDIRVEVHYSEGN